MKRVVLVFILMLIVGVSSFYLFDLFYNSKGSENNTNNNEYNISLDLFYSDSYNGKALFGNENGYLGIYSVEFDDAYFTYIKRGLEPNTIYEISAMVKGENIVNETKNGLGASVGVFSWDTSLPETTGTFDWKKITYIAKSDKEGRLDFHVRLGMWSNLAKGKAYFKDIKIKRYDKNQITGDVIRLNLGEKLYMPKYAISSWLVKLESAYYKYFDLTGYDTHDSLLDITFDNYSDFWGLAGNPIQINNTYKEDLFNDIKSLNNEWSFGVIHEISHTFDNPNWNFDGEFMANFKMAYVLDTLNAGVYQNNILYTKNIIDYYEYYYNNDILNKKYSNDGLTYMFLKIVEKYGWNPFKNVFRSYPLEEYSLWNDEVKYKIFIEKINEELKINIEEEILNKNDWQVARNHFEVKKKSN